jgi:CBS domain containing-hemolysin-like protein
MEPLSSRPAPGSSCLVGSAFFSASETALLRVRRSELDEDAKTARGPSVLAARELLHSMSRLLVTVCWATTSSTFSGAVVASVLAVRYLGDQVGHRRRHRGA